jgi:hypothetical protein
MNSIAIGAGGSLTASGTRTHGLHRRARRGSLGLLCGLAALVAGCHDSSSGGGGGSSSQLTTVTRNWNQLAIDASGIDHGGAKEQLGPGRSSRALAIVHIALFEAWNAIDGRYVSYLNLPAAPSNSSVRAAIGQAAHDTLVAMFPSQQASFDAALNSELSKISAGPAKTNGIATGAAAAQAILTLRTGDGSEIPEPVYGVDYIPTPGPGKWSQDPISMVPIALGAFWDQVTPFVMSSADQFRAPPPPDLTSGEYEFAYNEVKVLGGDGVTTPHSRSIDDTYMGLYWAYDGVPTLCAPPRLYNQLLVQVALEQGVSDIEFARLLTIANVAMADAGIGIWESKYFYEFWRPITGIRSASTDGNPNTVEDATYTPLGAPASNTMGPNFTPPFPAYPSGHAGFGGALFQVMRRYFGTDDIEFTFVSDELNGVTLDNLGVPRAMAPRSFENFSQAEEENGQSRIYLGIHWKFDKTESIVLGRQVGDLAFDTLYQPVP